MNIPWKDKPDSPGDWLWVSMWSCDCCVAKSGIAFVQNVDDAPDTPPQDVFITDSHYVGRGSTVLA